MALTQPFEGMTPGRIGVDRVSHDRRMVVPEMHQLLGLAEDGLTEERQRAGVRPVNIRADQGQVLPQENSGSIGAVVKRRRLHVGVEPQHIHVRLLREIDIRLDQLVRCGIEEKLRAIIRAAHEHRPPVDGEGPAFGARL